MATDQLRQGASHFLWTLCCFFVGCVNRCLHRQSVPKRHIKFRHRRITQKKDYDIQNTAEVWNQELNNTSEESLKEHANSSQPNSVSNKVISSALECRYEKDANWNTVCFKCHQMTVSLCFIKPTGRRLLKLKQYSIPVIFNCAKFTAETPGDAAMALILYSHSLWPFGVFKRTWF